MDPALRWRKPRSADSSASVRLGHYPPSVLTVWHQIEGHPIIAVIFWLANSTTRERCSTTSGIRTSSTRFDTPNFRRPGSRRLPLQCDCYATAAATLLWDGPIPLRMNWPFWAACAVKRRAGICRPMQVTVRIRVSTARDEQDWQDHQR